MKIEVRQQDNGHIVIENSKYPQSVTCVGVVKVIPDIGVKYSYLQWSDIPWLEKYWVDLNNHIQPFTQAQIDILTPLVTNWVQPLGQEGNPTLKQSKNNKINELTTMFSTAVKGITQALPHEMVSWRKQEDEARAYIINNTSPTPFLDAMLATRAVKGETKTTLVNKIIANADAYSIAYASLLGKYQNKIKLTNLSKTKKDLNSIVW